MILSFDAAHTLMDVRWHPGRFAFESASSFGIEVDEQVAVETYDRLLASRWGHYQQINATGDRSAGDAFWDELTCDWLMKIGQNGPQGKELAEYARSRMYTPEAGCFTLYPESVAALTHLKARGHRMIVLSNWDYSLERTLRALGIFDFFEHSFASLEHGVEKPEVELFRIVESTLGLGPESFLHIGDNPLDDYQGARGAGWCAVLLDRSLEAVTPPRIPNLNHVEEAMAWTS